MRGAPIWVQPDVGSVGASVVGALVGDLVGDSVVGAFVGALVGAGSVVVGAFGVGEGVLPVDAVGLGVVGDVVVGAKVLGRIVVFDGTSLCVTVVGFACALFRLVTGYTTLKITIPTNTNNIMADIHGRRRDCCCFLSVFVLSLSSVSVGFSTSFSGVVFGLFIMNVCSAFCVVRIYRDGSFQFFVSAKVSATTFIWNRIEDLKI